MEKAHKRTLESAVRRCRRVAAHSLCADRERLNTWAIASMTLQQDESGAMTLTHHLPTEEPLESLAARVRPFTLKREPIHHTKIVTALRQYVTASCPDHLEHVEILADTWAKSDPYDETGGPGYTIKAMAREGEEESPEMTAALVGLAWIYGDLVHADDLAEHGVTATRLTIAERYRAAGILVTRLAFAVICTMNVMQRLRDQGHLAELDESVWTEQVTVGLGDLVVPVLAAELGPPIEAEETTE